MKEVISIVCDINNEPRYGKNWNRRRDKLGNKNKK